MKKILALLLATVMVVGMTTGCSLLKEKDDKPEFTIPDAFEDWNPVLVVVWDCEECGKEDNKGDFCSECGAEKPVVDDEDENDTENENDNQGSKNSKCDKCGWTPKEDETVRFCPECGDTFDDADVVGGGNTETPPETKPEEEDKDNETPAETVPQANFSNPFGFEVSINGTVVKLPSSVAEFEELGFKIDDEKKDKILEDGYGTACNAYKGKFYITLSIFNQTGAPIKFSEASVDDISFTNTFMEGNKLYIYGNLGIGSTKEDVKRVYGEPTRAYEPEGESYSSLTYEGETFRQKIEFQFNNNVVSGISISSDGEYR